MARYISDKEHRTRARDAGGPHNPSGLVLWVTADSWEELAETAELARLSGGYSPLEGPVDWDSDAVGVARMARAQRGVEAALKANYHETFYPKKSLEYRTKTPAAHTCAIESETDLRSATGALPLPEPYHAVVRARLRRDRFVDLWYAEEHEAPAQKTQTVSAEVLQREAEEAAAAAARNPNAAPSKPAVRTAGQVNPLRQPLRLDPNRPSLQQIERYHDRHVRRALVDLLCGGHWIDNPESLPDSEVADAVEELNYSFSYVDLGRQRHLQFSSTPGLRKMFGRPHGPTTRQSTYLQLPLVCEYLDAKPAARAALLRANPTLDYLLAQAGVDLAL